MKIELAVYNPDWISQFECIEKELLLALNSFNGSIEHIGSTSVPGLSAKPIIDILVGVQKMEDLDLIISPLLEKGYIYYSAYNVLLPQRRFFVKLKEGIKSEFPNEFPEDSRIPHEDIQPYKFAHIHVWLSGSNDWIRHIAFRDYLRCFPQISTKYQLLKQELSKKNWKDGNEYNKGKDDFIKYYQLKALEWNDAR